jgi:hypothetical protein
MLFMDFLVQRLTLALDHLDTVSLLGQHIAVEIVVAVDDRVVGDLESGALAEITDITLVIPPQLPRRLT